MANDNIFKALNTNGAMEKKIVEAENKNTDSHNQTSTKIVEAYLDAAKEATTLEDKERLIDKASQKNKEMAIENAKAREANDKHSNRATNTLVRVALVAGAVGLASQLPQVKGFAEKQLPNLLPGPKKSK